MASTYSQIFSIVDRYSAPVLKIEERLRHMGVVGAEANKKMSPHEKLFHRIGDDIGAATQRLKEFSAPLMEMGNKVSEVFAPLAAIGAAGSLAGVVEMVHSFAEVTEQLGIAARIAGTTIAQFQALSYAARQTGVDTDQLQSSMGKLNRNLAAAATGQSKPVLKLMDHLHISLRGTNGQILSAAQELPKLADAFAHTKDPAMQALMATTLFGKAGLAMLPLLDKGSAGLKELTDQFNKYGYTLSTQDVQAGDKFNESWKNMQTSVQGFTDMVSAKLAPILTPLVDQFTNLIVANRAWIATDIAGVAKNVADAFKHFDLKKTTADVKAFTAPLKRAVDALGGFKTMAVGVGLALTANFMAPLIMMTAQVGLFAARSALAAGSAVVSFARWIPAIGSLKDAFAALSLVMEANPFGVIVIGAVAAGAIAYELYKHWDAVSKDLKAVWTYIETEFNKVFGPIEKTIEKVVGDVNRLGKALGISGDSGGASQSTGSRFNGGRFHAPLPPQQHVVTLNIQGAPAGSTVTTQSNPGPGKVVTNLGYSRMRGPR